MWRGVRQQLLRLADLPPCSSMAATLHELHTGQPTTTSTAMLSNASIWHMSIATKSTSAVKTKYHPAIYRSRLVEYNQRLKQWRKELLAEVGATQAEEERQRQEKVAKYRAEAEARYEEKLDRQRLARLRLARERAEYEDAKVRRYRLSQYRHTPPLFAVSVRLGHHQLAAAQGRPVRTPTHAKVRVVFTSQRDTE